MAPARRGLFGRESGGSRRGGCIGGSREGSACERRFAFGRRVRQSVTWSRPPDAVALRRRSPMQDPTKAFFWRTMIDRIERGSCGGGPPGGRRSDVRAPSNVEALEHDDFLFLAGAGP